MIALALALHIASAVLWVGGMFFAYVCLRPAAGALEPSLRQALWVRVFRRFFPWVWTAIVALLGTGYFMLFRVFGGFAHAPWRIHVMQGLGILMMLLFFHVFFGAYPKLTACVEHGDVPGGRQQIARIRRVVGINTVLGFILVAIAAGGRFI
jgi:uncharacterized membrane protein